MKKFARGWSSTRDGDTTRHQASPAQRAAWARDAAIHDSRKLANRFAHALRLRPEADVHETSRGDCMLRKCPIRGRRFVISRWAQHEHLKRCGAVHVTVPMCVHCSIRAIAEKLKESR